MSYYLRGAILFGVIFFPVLFGEVIVWIFPPLLALWSLFGFEHVVYFVGYLMAGSEPVYGYGSVLTESQILIGHFIILGIYISLGAILGCIYGKIRSITVNKYKN